MTGSVLLEITGETLELRPERAVFWRARQTLLVADLHIGKSAAYRHGGIPVPDPSLDDLERLSALISRLRAKRLLVLGDLIHAAEGLTANVLDDLFNWRAGHRDLGVGLVTGNHDRIEEGLFRDLCIEDLGQEIKEGPFLFRHDPEVVDARNGSYLLGGHVHPAARLRGGPWQSLRLPCFVFGHGRAILPAFGGFTGTARFAAQRGDRVFVIADGNVIEARRDPSSRYL